MFWKNLKIALRHLKKSSSYTFINVLGLTIGFTCVILIGLYIQYELSYDQYHLKKDRLYRIALQEEGASYANGIAKVAYNWGDAALENIPEVINRCRFTFYGRTLVTKDNLQNYESGGLFADASIFELFDWRLLAGNPQEVLKEPNTIVLTKSLADKYFPNQSPIGLSLNFDNEADYKITGVVEDVPLNSHFTFNFLVSMPTYTHPRLLDWVSWNQSYTYLELKAGASPDLVATKMDAILDQHLEPDYAETVAPLMQPITDIHLYSHLHREMATNSSASYLYIFGAIALFILIIACLNFINLTTARAADRAKEVGVRKAIGASKGVLIRQFLGESMVICVVSAILAIFLAEFCLTPLNTFMGGNLDLNLMHNPSFLVGIIGVTLLTGLLSGAYPSFVLSAFRPVRVLKGSFSFSKTQT